MLIPQKTEHKEYRRVWEQGGELLDNIMKDFSNLEPAEVQRNCNRRGVRCYPEVTNCRTLELFQRIHG